LSKDDPIGQLYEEAGFLVFRRCVQMLKDRAEAQDVTHWTFVRALEVGIDVSDRGRAISWLYTTATHRCLTLLRNERTRRRIRDAHPGEVLPPGPPSAEARAISRDLLNRTLEKVDERTGEIALLTWGQGMSNARVAELFDTSTRTIIRARKRFEEAVAKLDPGEAS